MENREIKFRVWDGKRFWYPTDENELFLVISDSGYFSIQDHGEKNYRSAKPINGHKDLSVINSADNELFLLQYTGLKDKNGVDVFEGDIIPCKIGIQNYSMWQVGDPDAALNGVVEWNGYQLCWHIVFKQPNKYNIVSMQFGWGNSPEFEIIGNIYQKPELLK